MLENNPEYQAKKYEFADYYQQNILPALRPFERTRRRYLLTFAVICVFIIGWAAFTFNHIHEIFSGAESGFENWFGIGSCLLILLLCLPMLSYYKRSKENLLPLITNFFGKFTYVYQPPLTDTLLKQSQIVKTYDKLITDDGFSGEYIDLPVMIAEYSGLQLQKPTKQNPKVSYKKQAHGIFFIADMQKKFQGETIVVKDKGILNRFAHYKNLAKVGLESPEFEKKYEVYSDSQIEARYILTPVMLEYMLALKNSFSDIEFSFFDNRLFMNIRIKENYFEASNFFTPITSRKNIQKIFTELYLLFSIVDTLKLNQKQLL